MSLINQMLKDLESRRTPDPDGQGLLQGNTTHRTGGLDRRLLLLLSLLVALLALTLAYLVWERFTAPPGSSTAGSGIAAAADAPAPRPAAVTQAAPPAEPEAITPAPKPVRVEPRPPTATPPATAAATPLRPQLLSIAPTALTGSWQPQTLILTGHELPRDVQVRVSSGDGEKVLPAERTVWRDSEHLAITLTTGVTADTWSVNLVDAEGEPLRFRVRSPAPVASTVTEEEPAAGDSAMKKSIRPLSTGQRAEQHYQQGYRLLQGGDQAGAEKQWREALRVEPRHILSREGLAGLYLSRGRNVEAADILTAGLKYHPGHGPFATLYARLQVQNGQLDRAVTVLEQALETQAQNADFYAFLAALYQRQKAFEKSIAAYQRALSLQSHQGIWWMGIGISLEGAGKPTEAITAFKEAKKSGNLPTKLRDYVDARLRALQ